jgi:hypothetical protein
MNFSHTLPSAKGFFDKLLLNSVATWCRRRRLRKHFLPKSSVFVTVMLVCAENDMPSYCTRYTNQRYLRGFSDKLKDLALHLSYDYSTMAPSYRRVRALLLSNCTLYKHKLQPVILLNPLRCQYQSLLNSFLLYSHASPTFLLLQNGKYYHN